MEKQLHKGTMLETAKGKTGRGIELYIDDKLTDIEREFIMSSGRYKDKGLGFNYQRKFVDKDGQWHRGFYYRAYDEKVFEFVRTRVLEQVEAPKATKPAKKTTKKATKKEQETVTLTKAEYEKLMELVKALA